MLLFNMGQLCLKELEAMHLAQFKNSPMCCRVLSEPYSVNKESTNEHPSREESERVYRMRSMFLLVKTKPSSISWPQCIKFPPVTLQKASI